MVDMVMFYSFLKKLYKVRSSKNCGGKKTPEGISNLNFDVNV